MAITFCFGSCSVDWMFGSLVVTITFPLFCWLVPFLFTVFTEAFYLDLTAHFFRRNHYLKVLDFNCKASHEFNGLFLLWALGGSEACVSLVGGMTQLTTALMRFDKLSKL